MLHQQRRQESIFTKREQVLLMQSVHVAIRIFIDYAVGDEKRSAFVIGPDAVQGEAARKTRD
jgi:hypothetical protein